MRATWLLLSFAALAVPALAADPPALAACRGLLPHGGPVPGSPAFRVEIHAPVFTIFRGRDPLVCCGVGRGADPLWAELVALQRRFLPVACTPPAGD